MSITHLPFHRAKHYFVSTVLLVLAFPSTHAAVQERCVNLEHSNLTDKQIKEDLHQFAISHNGTKLALYQFFDREEMATFKLWEVSSGKLIKNKKVEGFEARSNQGYLGFSPDDSIVYFAGMTDGIPFWHLKENRIVSSPCQTAMGVRAVHFSDDSELVYSTTIDGFQSLCLTDEPKNLLNISYSHEKYTFDKKNKHLYANSEVYDKKKYRATVKDIGKDSAHISIYQPPVDRHPFSNKSNDSFASIFVKPAPNPRLLVAKSHGENLVLSAWQYTEGLAMPKQVYKQTHRIPQLVREGEALSSDDMKLSPDRKQVVFSSKSGVLVSFNVESGKVLWKHQLPTKPNKDGTIMFNFGKPIEVVGDLNPPIVIERRNPEGLILFDWKTGKSRTLNVPSTFTLSGAHQHGKYLILEEQYDAEKKRTKILLLNWQNGAQKIHNLPKLNSGYRTLLKYVEIDHRLHVVLKNRHINLDKHSKAEMLLFNLEKQTVRQLDKMKITLNMMNEKYEEPERYNLSYDKEKKQSGLCVFDF